MTETMEKRPMQMVDVVGQYRKYQTELDEAIFAVVRSGAYINGPAVKQFERDAAEYLSVKHAIGCASGTDALQIAMMALDLKPGDEVITTPFTFAATTETIALLGGVPVYVDIVPDTFNIDASRIEAAITPRTKAILPVHLFGQPCDMSAIMQIAAKHNIPVIEDAAQAIGATWQGKKICGFGDIACISYYPSKNLGAFGDAGMITTNDDNLAAIMRSICNHGSSRTYYHDRLGVNSRLDSIQAAILGVKLRYLDEWNARRDDIAAQYSAHLSSAADIITTPRVHSDATHIWHQYSVLISAARDSVQQEMKRAGIPTGVYYPIPLHLQSAYLAAGGKEGDFPITEHAAKHILSLPMHSELENEDVAYIAENLIKAVRKFAS